jgi:hypothetical protein
LQAAAQTAQPSTTIFFRHGLTFKQKFRRPLSKDKK